MTPSSTVRNKHKQRLQSQLVEEANEHLEARAWIARVNEISIGRWYGGPFDIGDFLEAKERGETVWEFLERMMAENYDPSCGHCGDPFCNGECIGSIECYYCGRYDCHGECGMEEEYLD